MTNQEAYKTIKLPRAKWARLLEQVEALPILSYTERSTIYYHQTPDRGARGRGSFYFVYDTGDRIFSPAKSTLYVLGC